MGDTNKKYTTLGGQNLLKWTQPHILKGVIKLTNHKVIAIIIPIIYWYCIMHLMACELWSSDIKIKDLQPVQHLYLYTAFTQLMWHEQPEASTTSLIYNHKLLKVTRAIGSLWGLLLLLCCVTFGESLLVRGHYFWKFTVLKLYIQSHFYSYAFFMLYPMRKKRGCSQSSLTLRWSKTLMAM